MHTRSSIRFLAVAALALAWSTAVAQGVPSYDLERLSLDPAARGSLVVGNGELGRLYDVRLSFGAQWQRDPLVLSEDGFLLGSGVGAADARGALVGDRLSLHFGAAATVLELAEGAAKVELSVRAPAVAWQQGDTLAGFAKPSEAGFARPWVGTKFAFLSQDHGHAISAALAADVLIPPGRDTALAGESTATVVPRLELGRRFGSFLLAAQAGGVIRAKAVQLANGKTLGDEATAALAFATTGKKLRGELSVIGSTTMNRTSSETQHLEVLAGARYAAFGRAELFALAGPGFFEAPGAPTFRALAGLAWSFARPQGMRVPPAMIGKVDPCAPGQAHTPEQCPALDDDQDGIANAADACPAEAGIADLKGCAAKDQDGDRIADHLDRCPAEPGITELQGCAAKDQDGDQIADHLDKCPDVAGVAEQQGCAPARAVLTAGKIELKEAVYFDTGKATIKPVSLQLLDDIAAILGRNPQVNKVVIEGHTDSTGVAASNRKLSEARAQAVRAYLVSKGVDAARLEAAGFGPDRPIADNETKAGRDQNRRVEFKVTDVRM